MNDWTQYAPGWAEVAPMAAGVLGRALYHFDQARRGNRRAIGGVLVCEVMIAIPMSYVGAGAALYLGLEDKTAFGFAIAISYLGPRLIDMALGRWLDRKVPPAAPGTSE